MLLIVTPLKKWRRRIDAYELSGYNAHEVFQRVNELIPTEDRANMNITLAHIGHEQLLDWVTNNVKPTWWEWVTGCIRVDLWRTHRG